MSTHQTIKKDLPLVIVLLGPTGSGKTELGIQIAEALNLNINNVDSRQIYLGMDIGTAKPTKEQCKRVTHFLINIRQPDKPITLWEFQKIAIKSIENELQQRSSTLIVGGSGLYIKAITDGYQTPPVGPQKFLREQFNLLGNDFCYELLKTTDASIKENISSADEVRTQRALEVFYATGKTIKSQQKKSPPPWQIVELGLNPPNLHKRIEQRTFDLYSKGLIEETKKLCDQYGKDLPMLQTIGYKEAIQVLQGDLKLNEAIETTTQRTKQLAKRQRTWFTKQHQPYWLKSDEPIREAMSRIQARLG